MLYFDLLLFFSLFVGSSQNYSEEEARILLNLAASSYGLEPNECVNRTFKDVRNYRAIEPIRAVCDNIGTICQSFVIVSDAHKHIYVVFKGSVNLHQILLEGWHEFLRAPFHDMGLVNSYFLQAINALWDGIDKTLNSTAYQHYHVTFSGHSLGGALASLAAARTVRLGYRQGENVKLVTFGAPRIGDFEFATKFDQLLPNSYRVVHRFDIVPHLPSCHRNRSVEIFAEDVQPCMFGSKMYHHGTEIWYPDGMARSLPRHSPQKFLKCLGWPRNEDIRCSDRVRFQLVRLAEYIWDHQHYFGKKVVQFGKTGCDEDKMFD